MFAARYARYAKSISTTFGDSMHPLRLRHATTQKLRRKAVPEETVETSRTPATEETETQFAMDPNMYFVRFVSHPRQFVHVSQHFRKDAAEADCATAPIRITGVS